MGWYKKWKKIVKTLLNFGLEGNAKVAKFSYVIKIGLYHLILLIILSKRCYEEILFLEGQQKYHSLQDPLLEQTWMHKKFVFLFKCKI